MAMPPVAPLVALSVRLYRQLLRAYPPDFRRDYGARMARVFRDCCQDAYRRAGARGVLRVWLVAIWDLVMNVAAEYGTSIKIRWRARRDRRPRTSASMTLQPDGAPILAVEQASSGVPAPALLSLRGALTPEALEVTVDAVRSGSVPGWRIAYDHIGIEMVRGGGRAMQLDLAIQFALGSDLRPAHVWVLVAEEEATRRREVLKFQLVGDEDRPLWLRIRADASLPPSGLSV